MSVKVRYTLVALVALGLAVPALLLACGPDDTEAGITITPRNLDFGTVLHGPTYRKELRITNHTDQPVTLTRTRTGCPCIAIKRPYQKRILPGETRVLVLELASSAVSAEPLVNKRLEFFFDHPESRQRVIGVSANLEAPFSLDPQLLVLGKLTNEFKARTVVVRPKFGYVVRPLTREGKPIVKFSNPVPLTPRLVVQPDGFDVVIELDPERARRLRPGSPIHAQLSMPCEVVQGGETLLKHDLRVQVHGTWSP